MELMDEERKSQLTEVAGAVRHRLQTTDHELEKVQNLLNDIKSSVAAVNEQGVLVKNSIDSIKIPGNLLFVIYIHLTNQHRAFINKDFYIFF